MKEMGRPSDKQQRNFNIRRDRLSGHSYAQLGKDYELSRTQLANIIQSQLAKIADFDHECCRRFLSLSAALEESERHSRRLAATARNLEYQNDYLSTTLALREKELKAACVEAKGLRRMNKDLSEKLRLIEQASHNPASLRQAVEYEKVKANIKKFR